MMRNNLLNFAEFEREIGFYMGGVMMFGYASKRKKREGQLGSYPV
jgi:hypothetical protein